MTEKWLSKIKPIQSLLNWYHEHGPLAYINGVKMKDSALADAYEIHGDGVARMIPEKLVQRQTFQDNLAEINAAVLVERSGWVSADDELPDESRIVLAYFPKATGWQIRTMSCEDRDTWFDSNDYLTPLKVSHWMSLPETPKSGS